MTTPIKTLHSRLDRLAQHPDDGRFALEIGDHAELPGALSAYWKEHGGQPPLMVLILPERAYEPAYPTAQNAI